MQENSSDSQAPLLERVEQATESLQAYVEGENYAGYDPYDALNSPLLRFVSLGLKWPRIAVTQTVKHFPINLRPLLLVKKGHNPKGLGLFLWSYAKLYKATGDEAYREKASKIFDLLEGVRSKGYNGHAWGYNFNWQSRAFYVPKGTPTIVNTSFIGHALLDAYEAFGEERYLKHALPIRDFFLKDLNRTQFGDTFCFSYTPIDELIVHNANLLGASVLIRLNGYEAHADSEAAALASLGYSMSCQREDGSWWYADTDYQQWIDSFHTGFNLQCIRYFLDLGKATEFQQAYDRGVKYYAETFFLEDGTAKYFHDRTLPEDIHSYAQAIVFFSTMGEDYQGLTTRVAEKMLRDFRSPKGYFYFQKRKGKPISIPYMRWAQSWAFHGLTEYVLAAQQKDSER
jgi:rhamnogalacturonyl hydrolase YesR